MHSAPGGLAGGPVGHRITLPALDTMRAVGAIAVVATHSAFWGGAYTAPIWGAALARLDIGVALFFVLSGFLLSRPWFDRHSQGLPPPSARTYLWRRALRIAPVYLLAVIAAYVLLPGNRDTSPGELATSLLMLDLYLDDTLPDGLTQMWSLGTEVAFYVLLPVLMWLALSRRRSGVQARNRFALLAWTLVAINLLWTADLASRWDTADAMVPLWLPSYLTWFVVGMTLAACHVDLHRAETTDQAPRRLTRVVVRMGSVPGTCWVAALALFVVTATPVGGPYDLSPAALGETLAKNLLYAMIAGLVLLPAAFAPGASAYVATLSRPALRHLGHISYGIFSFHLVVLELVARWRDMELFEGRGLELFAFTLVLSTAAAEVAHRLVERPVMRFRDSGFGAPRSRPSRTASVDTARN